MMDCHDSPASWAPVTTSLGSKMVIRGTGSSMAYRMGRNCPKKKKPVKRKKPVHEGPMQTMALGERQVKAYPRTETDRRTVGKANGRRIIGAFRKMLFGTTFRFV